MTGINVEEVLLSEVTVIEKTETSLVTYWDLLETT